MNYTTGNENVKCRGILLNYRTNFRKSIFRTFVLWHGMVNRIWRWLLCYLFLLKGYIEKFKCSLYAFCLMDTHLYLLLDPKGFDVSKFMNCLSTAYVRFYNIKYSRHSRVFQGRFPSEILDSSRCNFAVSAYIHNNPQDIKGFQGRKRLI